MLLITAAYGLLVAFFLRPRASEKMCLEALARAIVLTHLTMGAFVAGSTELLSATDNLAFGPLLAAWSTLVLVSFALAWRQVTWRSLRVLSKRLLRSTKTPWSTTLVTIVVLILVFTLATALLYPPNTWDSMSYHMARVAHWEANRSIDFYPTSINRQNIQMPLAEFAILHLQILSDSDRYANLVQWTSFLALIALGLLVGAELGFDDRQQRLSAVIVATLPMATLQASSTQNDLVVASFVMAFAWLLLCLRRSFRPRTLLLTGCALGLALLTKGTAYLYCAAIGPTLAFPVLWQQRGDARRLLARSVALGGVVVLALAMNLGHLSRNHQLDGNLLGGESAQYRNQDSSAKALIANIVRNSAAHLATPSARVNGYSDRAVRAILGDSVSDPRTTWRGSQFGIRFTRHESRAGNLLHILLLLPAFVALPLLVRRQRRSAMACYALGTVLAGVGFCWVLKWQPWGSRLQLPLFGMLAPLLAALLASRPGRASPSELDRWRGAAWWRLATGAIVLLMIAYSTVFVFANESRSLLSRDWLSQARTERVFTLRRDLLPIYRQVIAHARQANAREVGLYFRYDDWEYPLWRLARTACDAEDGKNARSAPDHDCHIRFRHVGVRNASRRLGRNEPLPPFVLASRPLRTWRHASRYSLVFAAGGFALHHRAAADSGPPSEPDSGPVSGVVQ